LPYTPSPIDTTHVQLAPELTDLVEKLARNVHDAWAKRRIEEGWSHGPWRDDGKKQTPLLVAFDELPESEKEYDRETALQTLKVLVALGGSIEAPKPAPAENAPGVSGLLAAWHSRRPGQLTLEQYRELGRRANAMGESLIASDIADEGRKTWGSDAELRRIKALALARMGSYEEAQELLAELQRENETDEETLGLLARTYKDLWLESADPNDLDRAYESYSKAYGDSPERYWTGINAATLAFARGESEIASALAALVREFCLNEIAGAAGEERYWLAATLAEAALLLGDVTEAESYYAEAYRLATGEVGHVSTTWRNAGIILRYLDPDLRARIERTFPMPAVAIFAGHRIDEPGRAEARFPNELAAVIKAAIFERLEELNARVGYSSAASGSDILFLEALQELGGQTHIVLPCNPDQFLRESVASSGSEWTTRFHDVISRAEEVIIASDQRLRLGSIAYDYSNELLYGLSTARAQELDTRLVRLAVWDGAPGYGPGGTADIVERWKAGGHKVEIINPLELMRKHGVVPRASGMGSHPAAAPPIRTVPGVVSEIRAMIFADAYHFSKLSEDQLPRFLTYFMGPVAALANRAAPKPLYQNTWGDGLFFVFEKLADAGRFALKLAERVAAIDRRAAGLPDELNLRIALHAGPVYRFTDQIIEKVNYIGSHVNRAARIEPVTPPGKIYASNAFAGLAALHCPGLFRFHYVGRIPLAKRFGELPVYQVLAL
jgi:class 3 adenylate cyclase